MKKHLVLKIAALIVVGIAVIVGVDYWLGTCFGGEPHRFVMYFITFSLLYAVFAVFVVCGKEKFKEKKAPYLAVIGTALICLTVMVYAYDGMNTYLANKDYKEYKATVTDHYYDRLPCFGVYFYNQNGEEAEAHIFTYKYDIVTEKEAEEMLDVGDEITVKEYQGRFGYPVYRVEELNDIPIF